MKYPFRTLSSLATSMKESKRYALSLSIWFCIPDQGMKDFEILCRTSAFIVKSRPNPRFQHRYHIVTSSHSVAPWRWPNYYKDQWSWLQNVNQDHTHYSLELRHSDGIFLTQSELIPVSFHHKTRDFAVMHLMNEADVVKVLTDLELQILNIATEDELIQSKDLLEFHGHDVSGATTMEEDQRVPVPVTISGSLIHRTGKQTFAKTEQILMDGMCGGPVLVNTRKRTDGGTIINKKAIGGVVEGIIPGTFQNPSLAGAACFAEGVEIDR